MRNAIQNCAKAMARRANKKLGAKITYRQCVPYAKALLETDGVYPAFGDYVDIIVRKHS